MRRFDTIIVGGGIAGLATAEMFARSGHKTLLLEKNPKLCQETSGLHHEWFHFGSLYSMFPNKQFLRTMVGGIDDLLQYYRDFRGMNLRIDGEGRLLKIPVDGAWFREDNLEYIIATTRAQDFSLKGRGDARQVANRALMRLVWNLAIKRFIGRHNRFYDYDWRRGFASYHIPHVRLFDYSNNLLHKFDNHDIDLDPSCHIAMHSYDSPMQAVHIVSDLTRGLLCNGGQIRTGVGFRGYRTRTWGVEVELEDDTRFLANKLILASGQALQQQSGGRIKIHSVASPLLVTRPAVCTRNIVRLTPFIDETINHIRHEVDGYDYSLIGGGYFAPLHDEQAMEEAGNRLLRRARAVFPQLANVDFVNLYFGVKSEMISTSAKRNYLYHVEQIEPDVYGVVPGKFSLAFSLAFTTFREVAGAFPKTYTTYEPELDVSEYVELTKHRKLIRQYMVGSVAYDDEPAAMEVAA